MPCPEETLAPPPELAQVGEMAGAGPLTAAPALAAVLSWQTRLEAEPGPGAATDALQATLRTLGSALQDVLQGYADQSTSAIQK